MEQFAMTSRRTQRLRVAVAGVGSFAQRVLIPGLCVSELAEVVAVFGPTPIKTQEVADRNSVPGVFNDYDAMLDDAKPDAVVIATPNDVHLPMSLAASGRGIHIVCEKPLGIDLAQATQMHDHAASFRHLRHLVRSGAIGALRHFTVTFHQDIRASPLTPLGFRMLRERGGGSLLDVGIHMIDTVRWLAGEFHSVAGTASTVVRSRPTSNGDTGEVTADDTASFVAKMVSGATGIVQVSQVAFGRGGFRRIELFGSEGSAVMEEERNQSPTIRVAGAGTNGMIDEPTPDILHVSFEDFPRAHVERMLRSIGGVLCYQSTAMTPGQPSRMGSSRTGWSTPLRDQPLAESGSSLPDASVRYLTPTDQNGLRNVS
ncbi:MAG: gfo/Idh/MocA family oxidoreductase [Chloroflexi bacterium]|nr:gfo/Idh/MocA family oxidoreductase [Chloroflexota bacterium]